MQVRGAQKRAASFRAGKTNGSGGWLPRGGGKKLQKVTPWCLLWESFRDLWELQQQQQGTLHMCTRTEHTFTMSPDSREINVKSCFRIFAYVYANRAYFCSALVFSLKSGFGTLHTCTRAKHTFGIRKLRTCRNISAHPSKRGGHVVAAVATHSDSRIAIPK